MLRLLARLHARRRARASDSLQRGEGGRPERARRGWALVLVVGASLAAAAALSGYVLGQRKAFEVAEATRAPSGDTLASDGVQAELALLRSEVALALRASAETEELARRLRNAEEHLGSLGHALEAQASSLLELEETQASFVPGIERELRERDERLQKRQESLSVRVEDAQRAASDSQKRLMTLDRGLSNPVDVHRRWRELVGPVVRLAGESSVGSGVLLPSGPSAEGTFRSYILTAWHVVRDIQGDSPELALDLAPVPVQIYREDGSTRHESARLLRHDPGLDAALLELVLDEPLEFGARLAPRSRLAQVSIFDPIVAVGCPLGNDPIPTRGEIATCHHEDEGVDYWMINAPAYIGNSGGGIFGSESHELLGIFSKVYSYGRQRPTIVPHMGLVTPLSQIYDWFTEVGFGELVPVE